MDSMTGAIKQIPKNPGAQKMIPAKQPNIFFSIPAGPMRNHGEIVQTCTGKSVTQAPHATMLHSSLGKIRILAFLLSWRGAHQRFTQRAEFRWADKCRSYIFVSTCTVLVNCTADNLLFGDGSVEPSMKSQDRLDGRTARRNMYIKVGLQR